MSIYFTDYPGGRWPDPLPGHLYLQNFTGTSDEWLRSEPSLSYLREPDKVHEYFAVLQHYGVPTHYLDFSTAPAVAGYFATRGSKTEAGSQGCIICIDPDDMVETCRAYAAATEFKVEYWPEKVEGVTVPNLWRMQAQSGTFLYLPITEVENVYPPDRIIFTHHGGVYSTREEDIFPCRNSPLENHLQRFLTHELMLKNHVEHEERVARWKASGVNYVGSPFVPPDIWEYLVPGAESHPSWDTVSTDWMEIPEIQFVREAARAEMPLRADLSVAPREIRDSCTERTLDLIRTNPNLREQSVRWVIDPVGGVPSSEWITRSEAQLNRAWDGMHWLPYSDEEISLALGTVVALGMTDPGASGSYKFDELLGETQELEFATIEGTTSRGRAGRRALVDAFRDDIGEIRSEDLRRSRVPEPSRTLQAIRSPRYMFSFPDVVRLFASQIVPTQVVMQRSDLAVFFSPASLTVFGIA